MGKMKKANRGGFVALLIMLCLTLLCFAGCSTIELPGGGDGDKLAAVNASGVSVVATDSLVVVSWQAVTGATSYTVTSGEATTTVTGTSVTLTDIAGFSVPQDGKITVTIIAKGDGYSDSAPTTITYNMEGTQLRGPRITAIDNGTLRWAAVEGAELYTVSVNGSVVGTSEKNNYVLGNSVTAPSRIDITVKVGSDRATTSVKYDPAAGTLTALPVTEYRLLDGEILAWSEVAGAVGYKVVDIDFNSYTVPTTHYIMSVRNIVYGVYPVMPATGAVLSAEIEPVNIKYLNGSGTEADPYIVKTPFELRAVDYYELKHAENGGNKNVYKIDADMDYRTVSALESESNIYTLHKAFTGTLDGNGHTLSHLSVNYQRGFWALFDHIAPGATVKNITFDDVEITNRVIDNEHPVNPAIATVAYRNYGTVSGITLKNGKFTVTGGGIAGLVVHNAGTVTGCTVSNCELKERATSSLGSAAYEMAGVVLENLAGGTVTGCTVNTLNISGIGTNIGSSAGVVSINRSGATANNNSFDGVTIKNVAAGKECGGVAAYCAPGGTVTQGSGTLGSLTVGNTTVSADNGTASSPNGKLCGKTDR